MAKITLSDLTNITGNETSAVATLNANWDAIEAAFENTLSRDGTSPNTMSADIDLNGNNLLNVGALLFSGNTTITDALIGTPDTTTDNALVRWDGTDGSAIQNSGWTLTDGDELDAGGTLDMAGNSQTNVLSLTMTGGGTLEGTDGTLKTFEVRDIGETAYDLGNLTGNVSFDYTNGHWQYGDLTGNTTITDITNWPASGVSGSLNLELMNTGNFTVTFTAVDEWAGGTAPTMTTGNTSLDVFTLQSRDGGTTVRGFTAGQDMQ